MASVYSSQSLWASGRCINQSKTSKGLVRGAGVSRFPLGQGGSGARLRGSLRQADPSSLRGRGRAIEGEGTAAEGSLPADPRSGCSQKFADCFQINFEVFAFLLASLRSARRVSPALLGSETRGTIFSGRSVEEEKKLTVQGAASGLWKRGQPGRGRWLRGAGPRV